MAKTFSTMLIGKTIEAIWHTAISVYGTEYFFGGGVCTAPDKMTPYGVPVSEEVIGFTEIPQDLFEGYLSEVSDRYGLETYDILHNNCNHFTDEILFFLTGL